jgi:prepilin-type processing-associated H-X9-DG protein
VIAIIGLLVGLLIPAVQAAREVSRRATCVNQLKQLALALHAYHDSWASLPMGGFGQRFSATSGVATADGIPFLSGSLFVALLPQIEQNALYNAVNFDLNIFTYSNMTISATGLATLWCPSDPVIRRRRTLPDGSFYDPGTFDMYFASYAGNVGTWNEPPWFNDNINGWTLGNASLGLGAFPDGLSQTLLLGEHAQAILDPDEALVNHWWPSGNPSDTLFTTFYPLNPQGRMANVPGDGGFDAHTAAASSMHPGGADFAFADGSVRFLKDTIDSWPIDAGTGRPVGVVGDLLTARFRLSPGRRPGVYQQLSTRNGAEVVEQMSY